MRTGSCSDFFSTFKSSILLRAHRSTKAAGKLKVLPEEPQHPVSNTIRTQDPVDHSDAPAVNGKRSDSAGEASTEEDEELQDQEDVQVLASYQHISLELIGPSSGL